MTYELSRDARITDDAVRLCELSMELLETLHVMTTRVLDQADKHGIELDGLDSLGRLAARAERLMADIRSRETWILHPVSDDEPPDNAIECL